MIRRAAARWWATVQAARARAHSQRVLAGWGCGPVNAKLLERFGRRVVSGPFTGLVLSSAAEREQLGPYLLGVYEAELHEAWRLVLATDYPQIVDIGAKFGYYAVGLARCYPSAEVIAFDPDPWARRAVLEVAAANGVSNVQVRAFCDVEWLAANLRRGTLLVSDCEGYEAEVLRPDRIDALAATTLVVETHEPVVPGSRAALERAFHPTHTVHAISSSDERHAPVDLGFLSADERTLALHEIRSPTEWLLCLPHAQSQPVA